MSALERLERPGPKKLLALDGGGIRGLIAVEYLARIEDMLRAAYGRPEMVLADYFDYVAGTSTGAIIATMISLGMSAHAMRQFYVESGPDIFAPSRIYEKFKHKFEATRLTRVLRENIGDETRLGSDRMQTLFMIVLRNASTNSPWPLSNNPRALYNDRALADCNLDLPLWQLVRASAAAPIYFPPEAIAVGAQTFVFVDGAVTTYNNPAFMLFVMATLAPYRVEWPTGEERLLLVSIGTGLNPAANKDLRTGQMNVLYNVSSVPSALIYAASVEQDFLCRTFGRVRYGAAIDSEVGDLVAAPAPGGANLFSYVRYNVELSRAGLDALDLPDIDPRDVQPLDQVTHLQTLRSVGERAAEHQVSRAHFEPFLPAE